MTKSICFITTGDIKTISTAKRALGLANFLSDMGWNVSILMENTVENYNRVTLECDSRIKVCYYPHCSLKEEVKRKNLMINEINPDYIYLCAFVARNVVARNHRCIKIVEHPELQSKIKECDFKKKIYYFVMEHYSLIYADCILNASLYLQKIYKKRASYMLRRDIPMMYFPYAFNSNVVKKIDIDYCKEKYISFKNTVNFVFLGSITQNYGIFTILDAVRDLYVVNKKFKMLILGIGSDFEEAIQYVKNYELEDCIYMPGYIEEVEISEYFSIADAFISPMNDTVQDWARCPSKVYLYLPYQKPIITCKIGEPYQTLKEKGYYYIPGNSASLITQMLKVIQDKQNVIDYDVDKFSWKARAIEFDRFMGERFGEKKYI